MIKNFIIMGILIFFATLFLKPIAGFLLVSKNTMIWSLLQSGIVGPMTIMIVSIFLSSLIFVSIFSLYKA